MVLGLMYNRFRRSVDAYDKYDDDDVFFYCDVYLDPCAGFKCQLQGQKCVVSKSGSPSCTCNESCNSKHSPVCADDGRTYQNQCLMDAEACRRKVQLRVVNSGKCREPGAYHVTVVACIDEMVC